MGIGTGCARILLFAFTICFFIIGVAFLSGGIWILVSQDSVLNVLNLITNQIEGAPDEQIKNWAEQKGVVQTAAILMVVAGFLVMLISFFGCCGAVKESKCLLIMFALSMLLILGAQVTVAVLLLRYRSEVETEATKGLKLVQDRFLISINDFVIGTRQPHTAVSLAVNYLFVSAKCCGAESGQDARNSSIWLASNRTWTLGQSMTIPAACCPISDGKLSDILSGQWSGLRDSLVDSNCPVTRAGAYDTTCVQSLKDLVSQYSLWIILGAGALAAAQLFVVIFTVCLICSIDD